MSETGRVLHTGQAIVDLVMNVDALPEPGGDVFATSSALTAGGGFNVMAASARDGAEVLYLGALGTGPFADVVAKALAGEGIACTATPLADLDTGYCVAIVDATAERTFVSTRGAEAHNRLANLAAAGGRDGDVVYLSGYSLLHDDNRAALFAWLPTLPTATTILFDPSPLVGDIPADALDVVRAARPVWSLNAREAGILLGALGADDPGDNPAARAQALVAVCDAPVVLRDGSEGAWVAGPGTGATRVPAPVVEAVDTNGAGDAHAGVLAAQLCRGADLLDAVRRANVAAAIAVTRRGPATSPRSDEIDALLAAG